MQHQTFYTKIKYDLLNFREVQKVCHLDFKYLIVCIYLFHDAATLM